MTRENQYGTEAEAQQFKIESDSVDGVEKNSDINTVEVETKSKGDLKEIKVESMEDDEKTKAEKKKQLENSLQTLTERAKAIEAAFSQTQSELITSEKFLKLDREYEELEGNRSRKSIEVDELSQKLATFNNELANLPKGFFGGVDKAKKKGLETQIGNLQDAVGKAKEGLATLTAQTEQAYKAAGKPDFMGNLQKIARLKAELPRRQKEVDTIKDEIKNTEKKLSEL